MGKTIYDIIDSTIKEIKNVEDYYQIYMDNGIINIYNPFKVYENTSIVSENFNKICNNKIIDVQYLEEEFIKIILENGYGIKISILDEDFSESEAINIYFDSGEIIVF